MSISDLRVWASWGLVVAVLVFAGAVTFFRGVARVRKLDRCREEWREYQGLQLQLAEVACRGVLLNRSMAWEFGRVFGYGEAAMRRGLFQQTRYVRHRYASDELKDWWAHHGYTTFEQWAWQHGFRHKFLRQGLGRWR